MSLSLFKKIATATAALTATFSAQAFQDNDLSGQYASHVITDYIATLDEAEATPLLELLYKNNKIHILPDTGEIYIDASIIDILNYRGCIQDAVAPDSLGGSCGGGGI